MEFLQPAHWPRPKGYSHGVAARGRFVFVSGSVGWDAQGRFAAGGFIGQVRQALKNIVEILAEAKATPSQITRMTWYVVDKKEYTAALRELGEVYREIIGLHFPAMSVVQVAGLLEEEARVEIEATAVVPE
jgi:enamine deaminase RidA (YjgF/YER057c/UK114 family)